MPKRSVCACLLVCVCVCVCVCTRGCVEFHYMLRDPKIVGLYFSTDDASLPMPVPGGEIQIFCGGEPMHISAM
jgi:hypothetical protein